MNEKIFQYMKFKKKENNTNEINKNINKNQPQTTKLFEN